MWIEERRNRSLLRERELSDAVLRDDRGGDEPRERRLFRGGHGGQLDGDRRSRGRPVGLGQPARARTAGADETLAATARLRGLELGLALLALGLGQRAVARDLLDGVAVGVVVDVVDLGGVRVDVAALGGAVVLGDEDEAAVEELVHDVPATARRRPRLAHRGLDAVDGLLHVDRRDELDAALLLECGHEVAAVLVHASPCNTGTTPKGLWYL